MKSVAARWWGNPRTWYLTTGAIFIFTIAARSGSAQTASSLSKLVENKTRDKVAASQTAGNNPWVAGAQLGYKFAGQGDFSDNLLVAGTVMYKIPLTTEKDIKAWNLPVFSNVASLAADAAAGQSRKDSLDAAGNALLSSAQGIVVRLAPYKVLRLGDNTQTTFFSGIGGKVNSLPAKDTSAGKQELLQGRLSAGLEFAIGKEPADSSSRPLTVSVAAISSFFSSAAYKNIFGVSKSSLRSIEITTILPVQTGTAVLAEAVLAKGFHPSIRLGLLVAKKE